MIGLAPVFAQDDPLRRAAQFDAEGKCKEADSLYQQALGKGLPSIPLLNNLGNHSLTCGTAKEAKAYFERVLKLDPAHLNANLQLARLANGEKQGAEALRYLERVRENTIPVLLIRAEAYHYAGQPGRSTQILDEIQSGGFGDPRVAFTLGLTCARLGLYDRAESAFTAALTARPNDFDVLLNLGRAAARTRHFDRAQRALEVAARLRPSDVDCLLELGAVYGAQQDSSRAVYTLAQARRLSPQRPDVLLSLARAAEDAGYYGDSILAYDEYLHLRSSDDQTRRDRARVCGQIPDRSEEGRQALAEYVNRHPKDPLGHFYLAQVVWKANAEHALESLSKAIQLDRNLTAAYYARAWLLRRLGRIDESLADLKVCVAQQPGNVRALDQLGLAYLSVDQPAEAEKVLQRAEGIAPQDPQILMHLGRALIALDRQDEAQLRLDRFQRLPKSSRRDPKTEPGMIELATLSQSDRAKREITRLRDDARTHPGDADLQLHLASLLLAEGQTEEALNAYRDLRSMNADPQTCWKAGVTLAGARQHELALEFLERAATAVPAAKLDYAMSLLAARGPQEALLVLNGVPNDLQGGDYFLLRARILHAAGKTKEAETVLQAGMRLSSTRVDIAQQLTMYLVSLNRDGEALQVLSQSLQRSPDDPDLRLHHAAVLTLTNQTDSAGKELVQIQLRWPEWRAAYLLHGLLLRQLRQGNAAQQKFQMAIALDPKSDLAQCLREEKNFSSSKCVCLGAIRDFLLSDCGT